jgi:hypothetical protein
MLDVESSDIYDQFYLRPEPEIRNKIAGQPKPVLLKPVNESKRRDIDSVFDEYRNYDLRILYIYRDPVNTYFSQIEMWPQFSDVEDFIHQWNRRNELALNLSQEWKKQLAIVKYQDLSDDPRVFDAASHFFEIPGKYLFRADKNRGREMLSPTVQKQIDDGTRAILDRMDQSRTFFPGKPGFSFRKGFRNARTFLIERLRKLQLLPQ